MNGILKWAGVAFVVAFATVWLVLSWQIVTFQATTTDPGPIKVGTTLVVVAGFLATTVATTTAAWLGIEIRKPDPNGHLLAAGEVSWVARARDVLSKLNVVTFACGAFLVVGLIVLVLALFKPDAAPEMYETFMLSVLGWLAGAFAGAKGPAA